MVVKENIENSKRIKFDTKKSIRRAKRIYPNSRKWTIKTSNSKIEWESRMDRINLIRKGLPMEAVETIGIHTGLPIKRILTYVDIPQTTYNKSKRENKPLNGNRAETILLLTELINYGYDVFNGEKEKFNRWLIKPNISLGKVTPESLFDSISGINEVRNALNRIEYGNMA